MKCPECARLRVERDFVSRKFRLAVTQMEAFIDSLNAETYLKLRAAAQEAKIDLDLVDAQIMQHQDRHAVPN